MPRRASKQARNGTNNSTGTESLRLAIKGKHLRFSLLFNKTKANRLLDFTVYDYSRSTKDSPGNNLRTKTKLTRESEMRHENKT